MPPRDQHPPTNSLRDRTGTGRAFVGDNVISLLDMVRDMISIFGYNLIYIYDIYNLIYIYVIYNLIYIWHI